jgi:PBSX family phage terminase large subunit
MNRRAPALANQCHFLAVTQKGSRMASVNRNIPTKMTNLAGVSESQIVAPQLKFWLPELSQKQLILFNAFERYLLVHGARRSGKSIGVAKKFTRHCLDVKGARACMLSKNIKLAKEGGPWSDLVDLVIPEFESAGVMQMVTKPKLDAQTRSLYCEVSNRYGGSTRIYLSSLEHDADAERLLKSRRFSIIWVLEATNFARRSLFDTAVQSLRIPNLPFNQHQLIFDCNPAEDGQNNWIWKLWFGEKNREVTPADFKSEQQFRAYREFQGQLRDISINIPDNPYLSQQEIDELYAQYQYDDATLRRYFYGEWVVANTDSFFAQQFRSEVHILGNVHTPKRDDWEVITIPPETQSIEVGVDIGDRSTSVTFVYKQTDPKGRNEYYVIDEVCVADDDVTLDALTQAILEVMDKWEKFVGHRIQFNFFSDSSSFNRKISASDTEAMLVYNLSGGRIELRPVVKYRNSVIEGVSMIRRLLFESRLFFSAQCIHTITMMRYLKPERASGTGVQKVPDSKYKHAYDSLRYVLGATGAADARISRPRVTKPPGRIVSLG